MGLKHQQRGKRGPWPGMPGMWGMWGMRNRWGMRVLMAALVSLSLGWVPGATLAAGAVGDGGDVSGVSDVGAAGAAGGAALARAEPGPGLLRLEAGQTHVLDVPGLGRVAVGDGGIVQAVAADGREVLIFARRQGRTTLHVWTRAGNRQAYDIEVGASGAQRMQEEVAALLARIPNARSSRVGDRLLIEGEDLSDADQERISALAQRYPDLLDFTGQVGWDRMVLLDVQVIEVPRSELLEYGIRWDGSTQGGFVGGMAWDMAGGAGLAARPGSELPLDLPLPMRSAQSYFGLNAMLASRIHALAQQGDAVMLAQPQLLARSGATASFLAGGEVPYVTVDANGNSSTIFKPYGVSLAITPRVERNGAVRSRIEVEVSAVDASVSANGGPAMKTRRAATEFNVRSGQTLVLGGFISREQLRDRDALPGLGSLPVIGALFGSRRFQQRETELAILVTPVVVSQDDPGLQRRAHAARQALASAFPDEPGINVPIFPNVPEGKAWNPYTGAGSQWQDNEAAPAAGNVYDFDE